METIAHNWTSLKLKIKTKKTYFQCTSLRIHVSYCFWKHSAVELALKVCDVSCKQLFTKPTQMYCRAVHDFKMPNWFVNFTFFEMVRRQFPTNCGLQPSDSPTIPSLEPACFTWKWIGHCKWWSWCKIESQCKFCRHAFSKHRDISDDIGFTIFFRHLMWGPNSKSLHDKCLHHDLFRNPGWSYWKCLGRQNLEQHGWHRL